MKALVLYRSYYGNTKLVADAVARGLNDAGFEAVVQDVRGKLPPLQDFACAVVGAPTRMAGANGKTLSVLKSLGTKGLGGKPVALFDVYGPVPADPAALAKAQKWLNPGAAGAMENRARKVGLKVYEPTLRCQVTAKQGPLAANEIDRAAAFARAFAATLK